MLKAKEPFRFYTRQNLVFMTGLKAPSLSKLLDGIKTVPESVIYQHTHRFLKQHQTLIPEAANDFAYWVTHTLQEDRLGEELSAIDIVKYNSIEDIRVALDDRISAHIKDHGAGRDAPAGREFPFMRAVRFSIATRYEAYSLPEFAGCLAQVSVSSVYLHMFESRLRPPQGVNDFSNWFENQLGDKDLASKTAGLDPYSFTLENLRKRIISMVKEKISETENAAS